MGNALRNAGFCDGVEGWSGLTGTPVLTIEEDNYGSPGRLVARVDGTASADAQSVFLLTDGDNRVACVAGDLLEAAGGFYSTRGSPELRIYFHDAGGTVLSNVAVPTVAPSIVAPEAGAMETFSRAWSNTIVAPASTATAGLRVHTAVPLTGQGFRLALYRPYLALVAAVSPAKWDPGSHENEDLDLPIWPDSLPRFLAGSQAEPFANRSDFVTDSNIPTARLLQPDTQEDFKGRMRLTSVQWAALKAFFREAHPEFWFLRPDTDELCVASWRGAGAPRIVQTRGRSLFVEIGLKLRVF